MHKIVWMAECQRILSHFKNYEALQRHKVIFYNMTKQHQLTNIDNIIQLAFIFVSAKDGLSCWAWMTVLLFVLDGTVCFG